MNLSVEDLGLHTRRGKIKTTALWPKEQKAKTLRVKKLSAYTIEIPPDGVAGGGLQVIRFDSY